jgi:hypothetical protein
MFGEEMIKICTKCSKDKPVAEFYKDPRYDTLRSWCKKCCNEHSHTWNKAHPERHIVATKKWRENNPRKPVNARLLKEYGITLEEYERMLTEQNGKCAICGTETPRGIGKFHVDHSHETGNVRGLLCNNCNTALGLFRDSTSIMQSAIEYLNVGGTINA